jgi:hypothetical protein
LVNPSSVAVPDVTGETRSLAALAGKPAVLLFWSATDAAGRAAVEALARGRSTLDRASVTALAIAMPAGPRVWAETLPLTHALALVRAGITVGAPESASGPLFALGLTTVVAVALALPRLPVLLRDPSFWGEE